MQLLMDILFNNIKILINDKKLLKNKKKYDIVHIQRRKRSKIVKGCVEDESSKNYKVYQKNIGYHVFLWNSCGYHPSNYIKVGRESLFHCNCGKLPYDAICAWCIGRIGGIDYRAAPKNNEDGYESGLFCKCKCKKSGWYGQYEPGNSRVVFYKDIFPSNTGNRHHYYNIFYSSTFLWGTILCVSGSHPLQRRK